MLKTIYLKQINERFCESKKIFRLISTNLRRQSDVISNLGDVPVLRDDVDCVESIEGQPIQASPVIEVVLVATVASLLHVLLVKGLFFALTLLLKERRTNC